LEAAFKALAITLPSEQDLAMMSAPADPAALHAARDALRARMAEGLRETLDGLYGGHLSAGAAFEPDAASAGRRALCNASLSLLASAPDAVVAERAARHYYDAGNMTDAMGGLSALMLIGGEPFDRALEHFYDRWKDEPLVVDKWFSIQAGNPAPDALARVRRLLTHPAFDPKTPNRLRSLVVSFSSGNPVRFHDPSGAGYAFLADQILAVDRFNPMISARLIEPLGSWRRYKPELAELMLAQLRRIVAEPGLSKNVLELANKAIGAQTDR
jgi:aminopeptidase N